MWDFSFQNFNDSVWGLMIQVTLLLVFLVLGNLLRRIIPVLRKTFIPSALIGGVLLVLFNLFIKAVTPNNFSIVNMDIMKVITYHALAIGFIAMSLKVSNNKKKSGLGTLSIQNGLITGGTYMIQAVFGILTVLIFMWAGKEIFFALGIELPLAFGQGPGNAMTWDMNFSKLGSGTDGSFGLTLASIGFIVASLVGVLYLNIHRSTGALTKDEFISKRKLEEFVEDHEIEDNDSVDKLSIQLGIVAVCYAITFGIMKALSFSDFTSNIAWGFNFIFGVISATIVKVILVLLQKKKVIKYKYINNYQMDRISGFSFDLMIIAGVAAINLKKLEGFIGVIIALTVVGTLVTYAYVRLMTKHCYKFKGIEHEMFLVNFGTLTGTASNGMILLREVDTQFKTQSSDIFVVSQFPAMVAVAPLLLLLDFSSKAKVNIYITLGICAGLAVIYTLAILFLSKKFKERENKK